MWCFSQGRTFSHIIARTDTSWGRLPGCSVQDGCWKLSAECGGQSCSACTPHSQQAALQGTQQVTRAFVELHQYTINTTVRAGTGSRCVPAGTVRDSLCWMAPAAVSQQLWVCRQPRSSTYQGWLPLAQAGEPAPLMEQGRLRLQLHSAAIWLWASPFTTLTSFAASGQCGGRLSLPM